MTPAEFLNDFLYGESRIELYNPDGTCYFRADIAGPKVRQLQIERKRRGVTFQEVVHEMFMLGPVTDEARPLLVLAPLETETMGVRWQRLGPVIPAKEEASHQTLATDCPFCGHALALSIGAVPAPAQRHAVSFQKEIPGEKPNRPLFLTPAEAADALRVCKTTLLRYCRDGIIRAAKVGREYKIRPEELDRVLDQGALPKPGPKPRKR